MTVLRSVLNLLYYFIFAFHIFDATAYTANTVTFFCLCVYYFFVEFSRGYTSMILVYIE